MPIPILLVSARAEAAREKIRDLLAESSDAHLNQLSFRYVPQMWLDAKPALQKLFFGKCAYCEGRSPQSSLVIDHFRPKTTSSSNDNIRKRHLYYAWLAYEWENLLPACPICNSAKRNIFPVGGSRAALLDSVHKCREVEQETLIDPCFDEPLDHLRFEASGMCVPLTRRGDLTIQLLTLNRPPLVDDRAKALRSIQLKIEELLTKRDRPSSKRLGELIVALVEAMAPSSMYSGATRSMIERILPLDGSVPSRWPNYDAETVAVALARSSEAGRRRGPRRPSTEHVHLADVIPDVLTDPPKYEGRKSLPAKAQRWLKRVEISNFKSLGRIAFDLPLPPAEGSDKAPCVMLLGENAVGKSSILEAIALALVGADAIRDLKLDGNNYLRRDSSWKLTGQQAIVKLTFEDDKKPSVVLKIDPDSGEYSGPAPAQVVVLGYGPRRYFVTGQKRKSGSGARLATLFDPLSIVGDPSSWLLNANDRDFDSAVRALRQLLLLDERAFVSRPPRGERAGEAIMFELDGSKMPLERLSEGYRAVIATAVDVMRELLEYWPNLEAARGVVLIDELDTHLHPRWKMRILGRLRAAMPGVQFITTTHDPLCLRGAFAGEAQVLRRVKGGTVEQVDDLPNVQGLTVEQLLMSDYFGLLSTEDPSLEDDMVRYAALVAKASRTSEEEAELTERRLKLQGKLTPGKTPQEQLVYEAASEYLVVQRGRIQAAIEPSRAETKKRMLELWESARKRSSVNR